MKIFSICMAASAVILIAAVTFQVIEYKTLFGF